MNRPRMRPKFVVDVPASRAGVLEVFERRIRTPGGEIKGWVQNGQAELYLGADGHFFSPVLHVALTEEAGAKRLTCRFGPLPQVWLLFIGIYFILGCLGIGALMWGLSQLMIGQSPWALWGVPATAGLAAFVYGAVFIGQGLASEQMYVLRSFVDHSLDEAGPPA